MLTEHVRQVIAATASKAEGLRLLVVFGSRVRGDARRESDWDFGYVASSAFDPDALMTALVAVLDSDRIDLVDLNRAGGQLRFRAARDGVPLFAADAGEFPRFWFDAVSFWCDMHPVLRAGYEQVLSRLSR